MLLCYYFLLMSTTAQYDVIVIGGGPAGMIAAGRAASRGLRVLLLEKNKELGKKLSTTGGGRCNITNAEFDTRSLLQNYGDASKFLFSPFSQFGVQDTFTFFESNGMPLVVEGRKRAFPLSQKATDVTAFLKQYLEQHGVDILVSTGVRGFIYKNEKIDAVDTEHGTYTARAYILACGGVSHKETGSTGEGFVWLRGLGHKVHQSNPNLVPLKVQDSWVKKLAGVTLENVQITWKQGEFRHSEMGTVLCTHFGLSGPLILNSAYKVREMLALGPVRTTIDLFPHDDIGSLRKKLHEHFLIHTNKSLYNAIGEWFPKGVTDAVLAQITVEERSQKVHSVPRELRHMLVDRMKSMQLTVTDTMGFSHAVVSDGGVDLSEIDTKSMQSKKIKNLYIVGDMLHVNRPSGGFSLQLCWTTGWVAGSSVIS